MQDTAIESDRRPAIILIVITSHISFTGYIDASGNGNVALGQKSPSGILIPRRMRTMPPVTAAGRPAFPPMKEPPLMPTITDNAVKMNTATVGTHISGRMRPAMDIDIPTARASMLSATPASTMLRKPVRLWGSSSEKASFIIDEPTNISRAIPTN